MKRNHDVSDERLNAFIDNELDADERERLLEATRENHDLASDMCELRHIKELTQHAYRDQRPPRRPGAGTARRGPAWLRALAAGLLVAIGALGGWLVSATSLSMSHPPAVAGFMDVEEAKQLAATPQAAQMRRIVLHLTTDEPRKVKAALDTTEALIEAHRKYRRSVQMELVANAEGLNLLRADVSPHAARIRQMVAKYDGLTFLACNKAIQRLEGEGVHVKLVPEARVANSALDQILKRLREGWVYIKA